MKQRTKQRKPIYLGMVCGFGMEAVLWHKMMAVPAGYIKPRRKLLTLNVNPLLGNDSWHFILKFARAKK